MRIIVTADLHYDIARSQGPTRRVADEICRLGADGLLVLGDAAGREPAILRECLDLFDRFGGRKFFVAGNHDLWTNPDAGEDAQDRLERTLPAVCREAGFHPLDVEPAVIGRVGVVGSIGWYDFGYRQRWLEIPQRFYEAKVSPGFAARDERYAHLAADADDVPPEALDLGVRWMDGEYVRLPEGDLAFCRRLRDRLAEHLARVADRADAIVVGLHHLPFRELVPVSRDPRWAFAAAFMGSETFGDVLLAEPKVRYAFCGHSHRGMGTRRDHVTCINVGCTYTDKRFDVIEL